MSLRQMLKDVNIVSSDCKWPADKTHAALQELHLTARHIITECVKAIRDPDLDEKQKEYFQTKLDSLLEDK